ncbi:hypothetical protein [Kitasatospora sp. NPDC101183]|uniref:hypothetical protein n=1 Tax=Kitasatospora sp. NPDC101183 TaxID=3364100 RepID=UPI0037FD209F
MPQHHGPPPHWTPDEQRLWHAYRRGERLDLRGTDPQPEVRAEALTHLLVDPPPAEAGRVARLDLVGARVTGALDLTGARIGVPVKLLECAFEERVRLDYAEVTWWNLDGSRLPGLDGEGLRVGLWLGLRDAVVEDELWLHDARISGGLDLSRSTLRGADGFALMGKQMVVDGGLRAQGLCAKGALLLSRTRVAGTLDLTGARLTATDRAPGRGAADLEDLHARRLVLNLHPDSTGVIGLASAELGTLVADPSRWPVGCAVDLTAAAFTGLEPTAAPARARLAWLAGHLTAPSPAVHTRVAAAYRQAGREQAAREVLIHRERLRHRALHLPGRVWGRLLEAVIGYGYRPARALLWLLLLLAVGTAYFAVAGPPRPTSPGGGPAWDPLLYVIDLVVPFLSLGQRAAWDPSGAAKGAALALTVAGWVLATAVAGGAARMLNRSP